MSNSEDKTPKTNGLGTDPMQRLASFKAPRDLSLGGVKPNKKVFTPNLNVTRNKNKGPITPNLKEHKKDDKGRQDRRNNKKNHQLRNGPNVIKSTGVFSEGLGSAERVASRNYYGSRDSDSGGGGGHVMEKPTIRVKDVIKIDKELEEQKIKSAMGGNYGGVDEEAEDFKSINEKDAPVKLPMDDASWSQSNSKPVVKVKQEVIVKTEPRDDVDCAITSVTVTKPVVDVKTELFEDTDVAKLLRSEEPKLILLQLPDSLPGRGGSVDEDPPRRKNDEEPSTSSGEGREEKPVDNRCRLSELEEGKIGKLRVHRSGRVTLALGDTIFEVSTGTSGSFHQEVVSLAADDASRSARLLALGALHHRLHVAPDWDHLLRPAADI